MNGTALLVLVVVSLGLYACSIEKIGDNAKNRTAIKTSQVAGELLVLFRQGTDESRINAIHESLNVEVIRKMLSGRIYLIKIPKDKSLEELQSAYVSFPEVEAVEPNSKARILRKGSQK